MKRVIKRQVWNMCYQGQQYLSEGVQSIVRKDGSWQFSYRLWVEDVDGFVLAHIVRLSGLNGDPLATRRFELIFPPEVQFSMPQGPQTNRFYQKLIHRFFPTRGTHTNELLTDLAGTYKNHPQQATCDATNSSRSTSVPLVQRPLRITIVI